MKKLVSKLAVVLILTAIFSFGFATSAHAASCSNDYGFTLDPNFPSEIVDGTITSLPFTVSGLHNSRTYNLLVRSGGIARRKYVENSNVLVDQGQAQFSLGSNRALTENPTRNKTLFLEWHDETLDKTQDCTLTKYDIIVGGTCSVSYSQHGVRNPQCLDTRDNITISGVGIVYNNEQYSGPIHLAFMGDVFLLGGEYVPPAQDINATNGSFETTFNPSQWNMSEFSVAVQVIHGVANVTTLCETSGPTITKECTPEARTPTATTSATAKPFQVCEQIPESNVKARSGCESCLNNDGLWTAIGCFNYTTEALTTREGIIGKIMQIGLSLAGGVALLMILVAAFTYATSQGEPKRTGEAKEMMTSAIIGLIFIIFSVTILQFIGVNILQIPGFGER